MNLAWQVYYDWNKKKQEHNNTNNWGNKQFFIKYKSEQDGYSKAKSHMVGYTDAFFWDHISSEIIPLQV